MMCSAARSAEGDVMYLFICCVHLLHLLSLQSLCCLADVTARTCPPPDQLCGVVAGVPANADHALVW